MCVCVLSPFFFLLSLFLLVYNHLSTRTTIHTVIAFQHPDDRGEAKLPKFIVITGLFMGFVSVLAMPYDVANQKGSGGGIDMALLWQLIFMVIGIYIVILIPYAFWYYENEQLTDDESGEEREGHRGCCGGQAGAALCYTIIFFMCFMLILMILYFVLNEAEIPVMRIAQSNKNWLDYTEEMPFASVGLVNPCIEGKLCVADTFKWVIPITFPVYAIGFLAFLGWWFFLLFAGVGLFSLPIQMINDFRTRPKKMSTQEKIDKKSDLANRAKALLKLGEGIEDKLKEVHLRKNKERLREWKLQAKFEAHLHMLKTDIDIYKRVLKLRDENPLIPIGKLIIGVFGLIISIMWLVHIALFMLPDPPVDEFLNWLFIDLEGIGNGNFPLFGVLAFAIFAYHLLWAVIIGNFKLGIRFFFWKLYPMEVGNTRMNAFLVNTFVILLCTVPCVQFCATAFPVYAKYTTIDMLFGTQIRYLKFMNVFWENNIFPIALLSISLLTALYLMCFPSDRAAKVDTEIQEMMDERNKEMKKGLKGI
jgi:LMBR1 domain-containing protein 1